MIAGLAEIARREAWRSWSVPTGRRWTLELGADELAVAGRP
jgi:hypothetical protein